MRAEYVGMRSHSKKAIAMPQSAHFYASDIPALNTLVIKAILETTNVVEGMQQNISRAPFIFGESKFQPGRGLSGLVYQSIRGITKLVGASTAGLSGALAELFKHSPRSPESTPREVLLSAINGVIGDFLAQHQSPLAVPMSLRSQAAEPGKRRLLVAIHGSCMTDQQWQQGSHNHVESVASKHGYQPIYLRYNSGLHISENGRQLAQRLEDFVESWPEPIEELSFLAFSMGGLVTRSAWHTAQKMDLRWIHRVNKAVFLGTPHFGAPLERLGHVFENALKLSPYTSSLAQLGRLRSAGITDLRFGALIDEDWQQGDRFEYSEQRPRLVKIPEGIECFAVAGVLTDKHCIGDGLVPLDSAFGKAGNEALFDESRCFRFEGVGHLELLRRPDVCSVIEEALA